MELARPRRIERLVGKIARRVNEQTKLRIAVLLLLQVRRILDYAILCRLSDSHSSSHVLSPARAKLTRK